MDIVIDGVDVSECEYCLNNKLKGKGHAPAKSMPYAKETSCIECKTNSTRYNFCKHNPNCYYKQLKRLEQENEELKADIESRTMCITCERELQNCNLQAESERLKEENKQLKKLKFKSDGIELLQDANLNLHNANVKYRQALQEIRDIADIIANANCNYVIEAGNIIKKINEVIGAE